MRNERIIISATIAQLSKLENETDSVHVLVTFKLILQFWFKQFKTAVTTAVLVKSVKSRSIVFQR